MELYRLFKTKYPKLHLKIYKKIAYFKNKYVRVKLVINWVISLIKQNKFKEDKRLVLIYDMSSQPFSVGDFIVAQMGTILESINNNINIIDIMIILENTNSSKEFNVINKENRLFHLNTILSIGFINTKIGSILIFNSKSQAQLFLINNDNYYYWPSYFKYIKGDYIHIDCFNKTILNFYKKNLFIPDISSSSFLIKWANDFINRYTNNKVPVTINLRNNQLWGLNRNSKMEEWLKFFKYCEKYPVKFIIICGINEIDIKLKTLSNTIFCKDHNTTIDQELTLINQSAFHMGASSGPSAMAIFGKKPFISYSWDADPERYKGLIKISNYYTFEWSSKSQKMFQESETLNSLVDEFEMIWKDIEKDKYLVPNNKNTEVLKNLSWLR